MFAGIGDGFFHNEKYYTLFAHFEVFKNVLIDGNNDVLRVGLFYFVRHGLQSSNESLRFQHEWTQGEEHMTDFLSGTAGQFLDPNQFLPGRLRVLQHNTLSHVHTHGNCRNRLGGTIMQITGQLLAGLFLSLDHTFPLIHNILVETGILDGNDCLAA